MADRFAAARRVITQAQEAGAFAGAVVLVAQGNQVRLHEAFGYAGLDPRQPMTTGTRFDLASLTKVVCTTTLILRLIDQGQIALDDGIGHVLPEWMEGLNRAARARVTVRQLLTHTGGLPGWYPLYSEAHSPKEVLALICRLGIANPPGTRVEYSDLGFILLGFIAERLYGKSLDVCFHEEVAEPLGLAQTRFLPEHGPFAATERGNRFEMAMTERSGLAFDGWRDPAAVITGKANDGNAYYAMGGISGHAGLFGTAEDLFYWSHLWIDQGRPLLSRAAIQAATTTQTPHLNLSRGLGWVTRRPTGAPVPPAAGVATMSRYSAPESTTAPVTDPHDGGDWLSPAAFGHTGFTGTSIWIDPTIDGIIILLSNRIHPSATNPAFRFYRPRIHNAIVAAF